MNKPLFRRSFNWLPLLLVLAYALMAAGYFVLRYQGRWSDSDTSSLSVAAAGMLREGKIAGQSAYMLGFAYPALTAALVSITGLSLVQLQFLVYPLVAAGLGLLAFAAYREFIGDLAAAALGVLFLFVQPEVLFVLFRGSHEKFTWAMALLAFFLLARSLWAAQAGRPVHFAACVTLFYLAVYGLVSSNAFFGSAFIVAVIVSLLGGFFMMLWTMGQSAAGRNSRRAVTRLMYAAGVACVIWLLHFFWVYPQAIGFLRTMNNSLGQARAVALGDATAANPYATISWGWVSTSAYLGLVIPTFTIAGLSFIAWLAKGIAYLRKRENPAEDPRQFLGWLLYGGFGLEIATSVVLAPITGIDNLELRMLPILLLLGIPLVTRGILQIWRGARQQRMARYLAVGLSLLVLWMAGASLLKATNDPALSNYWVVWTAPEERAVQWTNDHLQYRSIWVGLNGIRLKSRFQAAGIGQDRGNVFAAGRMNAVTHDVILSETDVAVSRRTAEALPDVRTEDRVYDNGSVADYHLRPRTPYQP